MRKEQAQEKRRAIERKQLYGDTQKVKFQALDIPKVVLPQEKPRIGGHRAKQIDYKKIDREAA